LNIEIEELADVWLTFLHEGAGYKNSLGFYTYDINEGAPASADELAHTIIFPNASLYYGGGGLQSGDQIYLGQFPAGTVIGWFLVANGWNGSGVNENRQRYYSNSEYNPEADDLYKQHAILLFDDDEEKLLLSFEDLMRPGGDNDFNDAIFTVTTNPVEAVNTTNVNPIDEDLDDDDDGISDVYDDYPNDPERAFDAHYPIASENGTLAFEDSWPREGDYDLNDLVVEYHFHNIHNPQNKLIELNGEITIMAIGAAYHNGFSFELPFNASNIASWEGDETVELEEHGDLAVIHVFSDAFDLIPQPAEGFVNTQLNSSYYEPVSVNFKIILDNPLAITSSSQLPPYNPFLLVNSSRAKEVHLTDYAPTALADTDLFMTQDDTTNPGSGRYYKTAENLPWAIHLPVSWDHPIERSEIIWGYVNFAAWAESSGSNNQEWYKNQPENINQEHIFTH